MILNPPSPPCRMCLSISWAKKNWLLFFFLHFGCTSNTRRSFRRYDKNIYRWYVLFVYTELCLSTQSEIIWHNCVRVFTELCRVQLNREPVPKWLLVLINFLCVKINCQNQKWCLYLGGFYITYNPPPCNAFLLHR